MKKPPLPLIPKKHIKRNGKVDLWDVLIEGGPVKLERPPILAREALQRDPDRYKFDLPKGTKPGPLQDEADELARAQNEEAAGEPQDPVYGRQPA